LKAAAQKTTLTLGNFTANFSRITRTAQRAQTSDETSASTWWIKPT